MYEAPDSELVELLDQVSLGEMITNPALQDLMIRFLSSIRKALLDVPPEQIERSALLAARIYRANDLISKERREAAYDNGIKAARSPYPTARPGV